MRCFNTCSSCEEQRLPEAGRAAAASFNTCSSCEEQLDSRRRYRQEYCFNTCSSCEEQQSVEQVLVYYYLVSIHAPLARSNLFAASDRSNGGKFQYMLLLRGATMGNREFTLRLLFQYMLLLRGATFVRLRIVFGVEFQYMLLLRGATDGVSAETIKTISFNTCSSCEEQQG